MLVRSLQTNDAAQFGIHGNLPIFVISGRLGQGLLSSS